MTTQKFIRITHDGAGRRTLAISAVFATCATCATCGAFTPPFAHGSEAAAAAGSAQYGPAVVGTTPTVYVTATGIKDGQRAGSLVTGTDAAAIDLPFSVSSVSSERVREQAGVSLQDALRNVPGAQADSGFNGAHTQFFILRGAVADSGTGSNRILRDGVRLSNYPYVPAFVESVDVLRGPGAAVGVRSEPGGTVNIVTRQARLEDSSSVVASFGAHDAQELTLDLNRVLSAEQALAARVIATRSRASTWRHVPDELDGVKVALVKGDGRDYQLRAGLEATNQTYRPDYGLPSANGRPVAVPPDRQLSEPFGNSTTNNRIADLHAEFGLNAVTRLAIDATHLEANSTAIKNVLSGSPLPGQPDGTYARVTSWEPDTTRRISTLASSLGTRFAAAGVTHQVFIAADYYKETLDQPGLSVPAANSPAINVYNPLFGRVTAPAAGAVLPRSLTVQRLKAASVSLQDQVDMGDWSLVAGLRYTRQDFVYGSATVRPVIENDTTPKLGALYRLTPQQSLYLNLASGIAPNQVASSSNQSLPSRTSRQAEAGWKSLWHGGALASDVAIYRLKQSNMISSDRSTPLNNFDFTLGGSARSQGLEASFTGLLNSRTSIALTYAYTDAVYEENSVYGGKRVPNVARHAASLWGQYRWSDAWRTGAGWYVQGARYADEANGTTLPGYGRFDLTHTWSQRLQGRHVLDVQLALRNAFDRRYYVSSHLHVSRWITPAQGRNASVTATYRF